MRVGLQDTLTHILVASAREERNTCMYSCMHTYMHTCTCMCAHLYAHTHTHVCTRAHTHTHVRTRSHDRTLTHFSLLVLFCQGKLAGEIQKSEMLDVMCNVQLLVNLLRVIMCTKVHPRLAHILKSPLYSDCI